jgi:protein SCO1
LSERKIAWVVGGGLIFTMLVLVVAFLIHPFAARPLPVLGSLPDFALIDQNNHPITPASLLGQVWIADVIFTRCAGQCPVMSAHMQEIQNALPAGLPIKLVSFTTDPGFDTPSVLKQYAARFTARDGQWIFLTGSKADLHRATVDGLKLGVLDKPPGERDNAEDLFIHSQKLVLIDQTGHIRGYFDGETTDGPLQALAAATILARP